MAGICRPLLIKLYCSHHLQQLLLLPLLLLPLLLLLLLLLLLNDHRHYTTTLLLLLLLIIIIIILATAPSIDGLNTIFTRYTMTPLAINYGCYFILYQQNTKLQRRPKNMHLFTCPLLHNCECHLA